MFDRLLWSWEYEPIDLAGYIPDFLLLNLGPSPIAVECKPYAQVDASVVTHCSRVASSGWKASAFVLGAVQHLQWIDGAIGIGRAMVPGLAAWTDVFLARTPDGQWLPQVHVTGCPPEWLKLAGLDYMTARMHWSDAGNATQWNPPQDRPDATKVPGSGVKRSG